MEPIEIAATILETEIKNEIVKESIKNAVEAEIKKFHPLTAIREAFEEYGLNPDQGPLTDYEYDEFTKLYAMQEERRINKALTKFGFESMEELEQAKFYKPLDPSKIVPPQFERAFNRVSPSKNLNSSLHKEISFGNQNGHLSVHDGPIPAEMKPSPDLVTEGPLRVIKYHFDKIKERIAENSTDPNR